MEPTPEYACGACHDGLAADPGLEAQKFAD
jgi:hypothetical protein